MITIRPKERDAAKGHWKPVMVREATYKRIAQLSKQTGRSKGEIVAIAIVAVRAGKNGSRK